MEFNILVEVSGQDAGSSCITLVMNVVFMLNIQVSLVREIIISNFDHDISAIDHE